MSVLERVDCSTKKKKKGTGPYQKLIDMVRCRQRPVSERYGYNNNRLSRTGKANTPTPNSGFRERTGSYHYLTVPSSKRGSDEQLRAKVNPKTMLWQSCGLDEYHA